MNYPTYKIKTIKDLVNAATEENCVRLFEDLYEFIFVTKQFQQMDPKMKILSFDWTDDNNPGMKHIILNNERFEIKYKKND